jgi:hypothetical protein
MIGCANNPSRGGARLSSSFACFFLLSALVFVNASAAPAQATQKVVQGKVVGPDNQAQPGAIVYLKNGKTDDIKSFISTADGSFRFGQLSAEIDYELWADYKGKKSPTKTISSFDSKKLLIYELRVDSGK